MGGGWRRRYPPALIPIGFLDGAGSPDKSLRRRLPKRQIGLASSSAITEIADNGLRTRGEGQRLTFGWVIPV
jgi:hypothetical protein